MIQKRKVNKVELSAKEVGAGITAEEKVEQLNYREQQKNPIDYDGDEFYNEIFAICLQGAVDKDIAEGIQERFGDKFNLAMFNQMKNGKYRRWTKEENERRSKRIQAVMAHAREKVNRAVRGRFLKAAMGGVIIHTKTVATRRIKVGGVVTADEEVIVTETDTETPPNAAILARWLRMHDTRWRDMEDGKTQDKPAQTPKGIDIDKWITQKHDKEEK